MEVRTSDYQTVSYVVFEQLVLHFAGEYLTLDEWIRLVSRFQRSF